MPRQRSNVPTSTRLRDNQRRARARRKELVEDLQRRLHEYQRKELQATLLMQTAAKKVAQENVRLRDLLISRGVSLQEIDDMTRVENWTSDHRTWLGISRCSSLPGTCTSHPHETNTSHHNNGLVRDVRVDVQGHRSTIEKGDSEVNALPINDEHSGQGRTESAICAMSPTNIPIPQEKAWKPPPKSPSYAQSGCGPGYTESPIQTDNGQHDLLPAISDCFCPENISVPQSNSDKRTLEMSCKTAAEIIVGMRGDDNLDVAKSELGCADGKQCNVKNVDVLQIIDLDKQLSAAEIRFS